MKSLTPLKPAGRVDEVFEIDCVSDATVRQRHLDLAVARGLPLVRYRDARKGKVAIVASGPSARDYVDTLKAWDGEIWGINGAFHWMIKRGIKPHAFVGIDPEEILKDYLIDPPEDATYYLASQVHPGVFDHLKDRNVRLWFHADREIKLPDGCYPVPGGSSCLGRAPYLASLLGWQDVHLFGGDSSFPGETHVYGGSQPANTVPVEVDGVVYLSTRAFITQASDIVEIVQNFPGTITVHGSGLMPAMVQQAKDSGIHEWLIAQETAEMAGLNRQQRRAMKKVRMHG
jgi:hypothetical protein